jgi:hypothetical protein
MARYYVTIAPQPFSYEVEADSFSKAIEYAQECFSDEALSDVLEGSDIVFEEMSE